MGSVEFWKVLINVFTISIIYLKSLGYRSSGTLYRFCPWLFQNGLSATHSYIFLNIYTITPTIFLPVFPEHFVSGNIETILDFHLSKMPVIATALLSPWSIVPEAHNLVCESKKCIQHALLTNLRFSYAFSKIGPV